MPARFSEVIPNLLYRGGAPNSEVFVLKDKWGIKQIISLDESVGKSIAEDCKIAGIKQIILPVHEIEENGRDIIMDKIDKIGVTNLIGELPTYVHCKHGKDRTGMFIARYRTENGWNASKAVEEAVLFGFGKGVGDNSVSKYLDVINNGPDAGYPVTLEQWKILDSKYDSSCSGCGMATNGEQCDKCEGALSALRNLVDTSRNDSLTTFQNPGDSVGISDLWNTEENVINMSNESIMANKKYNTQTRRGVIQALKKHIIAQQNPGQDISHDVSKLDKENTETLIKRLNTFIKLIDALIENQIGRFVDLFKNTKGITYELIEEVDAESYFINLGKNLKKNIWRIIGNRYLDLNEDIDENKEKKEHTETKEDTENNKNKAQTIFDLVLDGMSKFNKDTHIGPMQKSLEEAVKGLADLVVDFSDYIENDLQNEEMQQHITSLLTSIQDQSATIKTLVKDRIIYTLNKDVLGKDKPYNDDKSNMSVLKSVINEEAK